MRYEFIIRGSLSEAVMAALPELSSTPYPTGGTVLFGPVQDEADVATLFARFADLGLSVVEMRRLPDLPLRCPQRAAVEPSSDAVNICSKWPSEPALSELGG